MITSPISLQFETLSSPSSQKNTSITLRLDVEVENVSIQNVNPTLIQISVLIILNFQETRKAKWIKHLEENIHLWLNDEIINKYMDLITKRSPDTIYTFNTFFYLSMSVNGFEKVCRWTKNVDIFSKEKVFIPIHIEKDNHWCLVCINFIEKSIKYYDSFGGRNLKCLKLMLQYLVLEHFHKKEKEFLPSGWILKNMTKCPQQKNLWDCGVFVCIFAEYLARDAKFDFTQKDMRRFRKQINLEITNDKLIKLMPPKA